MLTDREELIYLAGFFDGEGSILTSGGRMKASAWQVDAAPLELLHARFGGSIGKHRRSHKNPRHRDIYHWEVSSKAAGGFLAVMLPFLVVKRQQALIALQFQARLTHRGPKVMTSGEAAARAELSARLKTLNNGIPQHKLLDSSQPPSAILSV